MMSWYQGDGESTLRPRLHMSLKTRPNRDKLVDLLILTHETLCVQVGKLYSEELSYFAISVVIVLMSSSNPINVPDTVQILSFTFLFQAHRIGICINRSSTWQQLPENHSLFYCY